jgi:alpha-glucosidase
VVFAGDEVGAEGLNGEHARVTMPWDEPDRWDGDTFDVYRRLVALRRSSVALRTGGLRWVLVEDDAVAFLRESPEETVLVLVARAPWCGAVLPETIAPDGAPVPLYGDADLEPVDGGYALPADGPAVYAWRLR